MNKHLSIHQIKSSNQILMIREVHSLKRKSTKLFRGVFFFHPVTHLFWIPPVDLCQVSDSSGLVGDLAEAKVGTNNSMAGWRFRAWIWLGKNGWEWGLRFLLLI